MYVYLLMLVMMNEYMDSGVSVLLLLIFFVFFI